MLQQWEDAVTDEQVLSLLRLLESRGVVAWVSVPDQTGDEPAVALLCELDGFESAAAMLVARGFSVVEHALPGRLRLAHDRLGAVELHPVGFDGDGNAVRRFGDGSSVTIPAASLVVDAYGPGRARQVLDEGLAPS